jgi:hypothetical protein
MSNTIEAAELLEEQIADLKTLLASQRRLADRLGDHSLDNLIRNTTDLIAQHERTITNIQKTAE